MEKKIIQLNKIKKVLSKHKNKKIVHCHGVFDLLHIGHLRYFKKSKQFGDILIVSLTADKFVNKGPGRPKFNQNLRSEALASIDIIDYVIISNDVTPLNVIKEVRPNFYSKGNDYKNFKNDVTGNIKKEAALVKKLGGKVIFTDEIAFSSSNLINTFLNDLNSEQKKNIQFIKKKFTFNDIKELVDEFKNLKILVIGELIIDEYIFCEAIGKSGKEPVLTLRELDKEKYLGGAAAVARHLSSFSKNIKLITMIGENNSDYNFINKYLPQNVKIDAIKKKNSPTILKKRFVEHLSKNKVLGVYDINDDPLTKNDEENLKKTINKQIINYDLVIVSDYGHGFLSKKNIQSITKKAKFVAVNSQINSFNIGLHGIRNYKNLDCLIINEKEMRHELRSRNGELKNLTKKLSREQKIKKLIVTRGTDGALLYDAKKNLFFQSPAYSDRSVDKVGSGDAMLSLISLCLKMKFHQNLSLFISSLAGAMSVSSIGNKESISKIKILKSIENLLK